MGIDEFKAKYEVLPHDAGKDLWLTKRLGGITGTDIAAIVGLNPYKTVYDVFLSKLGLADEDEDTPYMRRGRRMEPVLAEDYEEMTGLKTVKVGLIKSPAYDFVLGTPDRLVVDEAGNILHGLEIKTAGYRQAQYWGPPETDQVPDQYLIQCQWYMAASDIEKWDLIVTIAGELPIIYHITRNDELISKLIEKAGEFWHKNVLEKEPPSVDASISAARMLATLYRRGDLDLADGTEEDGILVTELVRKKEQLANIEEEVRLLENKLKERIGDHEGIKGDGWVVTWKKTKDRTSIDYNKLITDLGISQDVIKKYAVTSEGYRIFKVKLKGGDSSVL